MTKATNRESGFALALTLVLMALIVIVALSYIFLRSGATRSHATRSDLTGKSGALEYSFDN